MVVATTPSGGIGINGGMAWRCLDELKLFRRITLEPEHGVVLVGRTTYATLPPLLNRRIMVLTSSGTPPPSGQPATVVHSIQEALELTDKKVCVCGGGKVYETALETPERIGTLYVSVMKEEFKCDTSVKIPWDLFKIESKIDHPEFTHYQLKYDAGGERRYLSLLRTVSATGETVHGRNGSVKSLFGNTLTFNLLNGFPLLTTRKMFWKGVVLEFLMFVRGEIDTQCLSTNGVGIWTGNTSTAFQSSIGKGDYDEGIMGPMYGMQWRHFNGQWSRKRDGTHPSGGVDQLANVINLIKTDPSSRRIMMVTLNPCQVDDGVLPPCHSIAIQFSVRERTPEFAGYLDMICFNRSQDLVLGTPFNIASSALLLTCVAKICGLTPRNLIMNLGDCHVYALHLDTLRTQLDRPRFSFPTLKLTGLDGDLTLSKLETLGLENFQLEGYQCHPALKFDMVA